MNNLLQVGHTFSCERFAREAVCRVDDGVPNPLRLHMSDRWAARTSQSAYEAEVDCAPAFQAELGRTPWRVLQTALTGGGTGWQVIAEDPAGHRIRFYQSGYFHRVVPPNDITLIAGQDGQVPAPEPLW